MARYHINAKGEPGRCLAQKGSCPFGGQENHYATLVDAAQAYEKTMLATLVPQQKEKLSLKQLNEFAKITTDEAILAAVVKRGSQRTLRNLAKNPRVDSTTLALAAARADETTLTLLTAHPAYPEELLTPEQFASKVADADWQTRTTMLQSNTITDAHLKAMEATGASTTGLGEVLRNASNRISTEAVVKLGEVNFITFEQALLSGRYPLEERLDNLDLTLVRPAARKTTDSIHLEMLAAKAIEKDSKELQWTIAANKHTPPEALAILADHSSDHELLIAVYRNPQASASVKQLASTKHSKVASFAKLTSLQASTPGGLESQLPIKTSQSPGSKKQTIRFLPEKVEALQLTSDDVDTYVRYYHGNFLFGASYDARNGIYEGYTD